MTISDFAQNCTAIFPDKLSYVFILMNLDKKLSKQRLFDCQVNPCLRHRPLNFDQVALKTLGILNIKTDNECNCDYTSSQEFDVTSPCRITDNLSGTGINLCCVTVQNVILAIAVSYCMWQILV